MEECPVDFGNVKVIGDAGKFFFFLKKNFKGPHSQLMEVPSVGAKLELLAAGLQHSHSHAGSEPHL